MQYNIILLNLSLNYKIIYAEYSMGETILFLVFIALSVIGVWLVLRRTGNYDVDFFTKILGWILLIPGIIGIMESLSIL